MIQIFSLKTPENLITNSLLLALPVVPIVKIITGIARELFPSTPFVLNQTIYFGKPDEKVKESLLRFVQKNVKLNEKNSKKITETILQSNQNRIHLISKIAYDFKIGVKYGISIPVEGSSPSNPPAFESHGNIFSCPVIIRNLSAVNFPDKIPQMDRDQKQLKDRVQEFLIAREFVKIQQMHTLIALIPITTLSIISAVLWLNQPQEVPFLAVYFANAIGSCLVLYFKASLDLRLEEKADNGAIEYLKTEEGAKAFRLLKVC